MLKTALFGVTLLVGVCIAQQSQSQNSGSDKQVRLEDIEREALSSAQQRQQVQSPQQVVQQTAAPQQHSQQAPQYGLPQQQLAAYQQQLLLQQLQQQYFAPQPVTYPGYNAVPLMIIPGNHLGVGSPALPLQAYFLPDHPLLYQQQLSPAPQQSAVASTNNFFQVPTQRLPQANRFQPLAAANQAYRIPQQTQQPLHNFVYTSSATQGLQQPLLQSAAIQQPYAFNSLYQQRQQKNVFSSGVKSTPAPPSLLKAASQSIPFAYSQALQTPDQSSSSYINYKSF